MFLLINKPRGVTSHDVVNQLREITGEKKIGHGGTLDPNATGLLVIGVTREGTKQLTDVAGKVPKAYLATARLGQETDTLDAEGEVVAEIDCSSFSVAKIKETLASFVGTAKQVPPKFSAVRVNGRRAYKLAREGKEFSVPPRIVTIERIRLQRYEHPDIVFSALVSSGTYIRSLVRDIGDKLGCGAYLKDLRRTQVGQFSLDEAHALQEITADNWKDFIITT